MLCKVMPFAYMYVGDTTYHTAIIACVDALINTKLPLLQALPSPAAWGRRFLPASYLHVPVG